MDDSILFRAFLSKHLSSDPVIDIVATASNPYEARDKIIEYLPDVMVLDVEMPKMNGIDFLKKLLPQYPMPVIVISSENENVFNALNAGAVDFVPKPESDTGEEAFLNELKIKIKIAQTANLTHWKKEKAYSDVSSNNRIISIGASTGGTEAIFSVLKALPENMPGIVIVQHMPPVFTRMYAERLNNLTSHYVKEAQTGDIVKKGSVLIAPGDHQMRIRKSDGVYKTECFAGEKVNGHCPSVDVLFDSVANVAGKNAIGVILTGMGNDGANGLLSMRIKGARTIGQDEASSIVYGMPKIAYGLGAVEHQASLDNIPQHICRLLGL